MGVKKPDTRIVVRLVQFIFDFNLPRLLQMSEQLFQKGRACESLAIPQLQKVINICFLNRQFKIILLKDHNSLIIFILYWKCLQQ